FCLAKDAEDAAVAQFGGKLAEGDAEFAENEVGGNAPDGALGFDGAIERTEGDDASAGRDLGANGERENAAGSVFGGGLHGGDAEAEADGLEPGRGQGGFESGDMAARNAQERGEGGAFGGFEDGMGEKEVVGMKAAFSLELEEAGAVGFGHIWDGNLHGKGPVEREAEDAAFFANTGFVEVIANFAADELGITCERREGEIGGERLDDLDRTVEAANDHAFKAAAVERQAEDGLRGALGLEERNHWVLEANRSE